MTRHRTLDGNVPLRVAVIGAISKVKGYDLLLACAKDARQRQIPLEFIVYGYSLNDLPLRREGVVVTGRYLDEYADDGLETIAPDAIWLPYVWPETYSYTLSIALRYGHPIFAFDLGAIASRLRALHAAEYLMPLSMAWHPREINDRFLAYRSSSLATVGTACPDMLVPHESDELLDVSPAINRFPTFKGTRVRGIPEANRNHPKSPN
jgi:hypothetical protein